MTDCSLNLNYEQKQALKKARYAEKAKEFCAEANAMYEQNNSELSYIPPDQPILVGHHNEKKHRRHLETIDNRMRRAIEAENAITKLKFGKNCNYAFKTISTLKKFQKFFSGSLK